VFFFFLSLIEKGKLAKVIVEIQEKEGSQKEWDERKGRLQWWNYLAYKQMRFWPNCVP
jgi:hypothetical protein